MRQVTRLCLAGVALGALGLLASGPLRARQIPGTGDFYGAGPVNTMFVEAPPRTVGWTRTWLQLQKVVSLEYPDGIKLSDLFKRVRAETRAPELGFPRGVPIYVDPRDLQDVDATLDSTVVIDLDGITLGKALSLALKQRSLFLDVQDDGLIRVDAGGCDDGATVDHNFANWESFDRISSEIVDLRAEVRALRQALRPHLANGQAVPIAPSVTAPPAAPR